MSLSRWRQSCFITRRDLLFRRFPVLVAVAYAAISVIWIATSDRVITYWASNLGAYQEIQTMKGWAFVLGSALLIYFVLQEAWTGIIAAFESVAESEHRLNLALSCAGGEIWEVDLDDNRGTRVHISSEFAERLGLPNSENITLDDIRMRRHPDDAEATDSQLQASIDSGGKVGFDMRYRLRSDAGGYRWVHSRGNVVVDGDGKAKRMVGVVMDIDRRMKAEEEILHLKRFDAATGLAKPNEFLATLAQLQDAGGPDGVMAVAEIRLTGLSHQVVDGGPGEDAAAVQLFAERLRSLPDFVAARFGSDVFALAPAHALAAGEAQRLLTEALPSLLRPLDIAGETVRLRAQIGGAIAGPASGGDLSALLRSSANALERAEVTAEGVICWSDETLNEEFRLRSDRMRGLEHAIHAGEIECYFQPLIDLRTGRTAGFEALARWNRPGEGIVSPDKFIPLAEEMDLIGDLGRSILQQACRAAAAWPADSAFVAVNVSAHQLDDPAFPDTVRSVLTETGLDPARLELEITENALPRNPDEVARRILELRALGVSIAIDDFGTGYSSFGLLAKLPFSRLKIDRSFMSDCQHRPEGMILIDVMTGMAKSLRLAVTAEGVETAEQAAMLVAKGVDIAQGYLYSKPVPHAEALAQLDRDWASVCPALATPSPESRARIA